MVRSGVSTIVGRSRVRAMVLLILGFPDRVEDNRASFGGSIAGSIDSTHVASALHGSTNVNDGDKAVRGAFLSNFVIADPPSEHS